MSDVNEQRLNQDLKKALKLLCVSARAAVFLLPPSEMGRLKRKFSKKRTKKEVDVLAFPEPKRFPHPEGRKRPLGEIYINSGIRNDLEKMRFLAIHGLLHLLGYTHDKKNDTIRMQMKEEELLSKIKSHKRQITN